MTLDDHCMNTYNLFCNKIPHKTLLNLEYVNGYAMGAKLHDFGKIMVQTFDENGIAHYYGHSSTGSYFYSFSNGKNLLYGQTICY